MTSNRDKITIRELEGLSADKMYDFIDGITDDMAQLSDVGGDSDAEDNVLVSTPSSRGTSRSSVVSTPDLSTSSTPGPFRPSRQSVRNKSLIDLENPLSDFDSDDSIADKNYIPEKKTLKRRLSSSSSISDDTSQEDFILPEVEVGQMQTIFSEEFQNENQPENEEEDDMRPGTTNFLTDFPMKWTKNPRFQEKFKNFNFSQNFGSELPNISDATPLQIFKKIFSDELLNKIVDETNLYASQSKHNFSIEKDELQAFFGILIIMGFHQLPGMRMYWSYDPNFRVERIASIMSVKRFLAILRHIHLNDNEKCPQKGENNFDRLYKLRPLVDHLNKEFKLLFSPSRELSIDESMVGFKGRSSLKQYMPMKPIKRGFKIWVMTCSRTGYMLSFKVYEGKENSHIEGTLGERTVLHLSEPYHFKGYALYFDNFFSTIELLSNLLQKNTFACGTFRINRKHYPKDHLLNDNQLKLGESDFVGDENTGISVCKWRDRGKKCVVVISSLHDPAIKVDVARTNKEGQKEKVPCPQSVAEYNKFMGGVDLFDQHLASYSISWKSRKWWIKIFMYLLDASIVNAYILYKTSITAERNKAMSHLQFRSILANELIGNFSGRKQRGAPTTTSKNKMRKIGGRSISTNNITRKTNVGVHLPVKGNYRRCARCSTKTNVKRSKITCNECNVGLCLECFVDFHS